MWRSENFKEMTANDRRNVAMKCKLYFRCLSDGHRGESCFRCKTCGINTGKCCPTIMWCFVLRTKYQGWTQRNKVEWTLQMHHYSVGVTSGPAREGKPNERTCTITSSTAPSTKFVALRTVPVRVNALLDGGSSETYLNSDITAELGLEGSSHESTLWMTTRRSLKQQCWNWHLAV